MNRLRIARSGALAAVLLVVVCAPGCPSSDPACACPDSLCASDVASPSDVPGAADRGAPLDGRDFDARPPDTTGRPDAGLLDVPPGADAESPLDAPPTDASPLDAQPGDAGPGTDSAGPTGAPLANLDEAGRQWGAEVAALADGGFAVAWMSSPPDGGGASIVLRVFHADGTPRTGEIAVDPDSGARQDFPAVAGLVDGGIVVVWRAARLEEAAPHGLAGRVFDAGGAPRGDVVLLSAYDERVQGNPSLATLAGGDLVLAWEWWGYDGDSAGVVARLLSPTLTPRGANFLPAEVTDDAQSTPRAAALPDGGFVLTWESTITAGYDVRARRFAADGAPTGPELAVNRWDTNGVQRGARPLALGDGSVFIAYGDESSGFGVTLQLFPAGADESAWSGAVGGDLTWAGQPAVAAHRAGATVFFQARPTADAPLAIWRADWSTADRSVAAPVLVHADPQRFWSAPEATALRDGGQVVVWQCEDADREGVCLAVLRTVVEGPPDWAALPCALAWETCAPVFPGCWAGEDCPAPADCPITGCGTDGPAVERVVFGVDACGVPWVDLVEPSGRLATRPWTDGASPYPSRFHFDVLLDGAPTTRCSIEDLPTGAIRYQLLCFEPDGTPAYAAVLEPDAGCPPCADPAGCYALDAPPILCTALLPCPEPPERARVEASAGGCTATLRLEEPPGPLALPAWTSTRGFLTLSTLVGDPLEGDPAVPRATCTLAPAADGYGPAVCTLVQGGQLSSFGLDLRAVRDEDDPTCALPECVLDTSCEQRRVGDRCREGACTCAGGPPCGEGTVCAPESGVPGGCVPTPLWDDPRACFADDDCRRCLADAPPACCDQLIDGSALDAVNVFHDCPTCCTCEHACEDVLPPGDVACEQGRCQYRW